MAKRRRTLGFVTAIMLSIILVVSGCATKTSPKTAVENGLVNTANMKSGSFNMGMSMSLDFPEDVLNSTPEVAMVSNLLKNADIKVNGVFKRDPQQIEMTLELNLKGDMEIKLSIPMVVNQEKIWIKVPSIPFFELPQELVGKYIEIDLKELSEMSGESFNAEKIDVQKSQEFGQEMLKVILESFDEQTYFTRLKKDEAKLPDGIEAKDIVKFTITDENLQDVIKTFVEVAAPKILDLMANDKYADLLNISKEEIEKAKKDLQSESNKDSEIKEAIDELRKSMKINELSILTVVNKKDFINYQEFNVDVDLKEEGQSFKLGLKGTIEYNNINEDVEFKVGTPSDSVKLEDFISEMDAMYDTGDEEEYVDPADFNVDDIDMDEFIKMLEAEGIDPDEFFEMLESEGMDLQDFLEMIQ